MRCCFGGRRKGTRISVVASSEGHFLGEISRERIGMGGEESPTVERLLNGATSGSEGLVSRYMVLLVHAKTELSAT